MIKAARKTASNAELARAFEDIFRAPTHEHVEIFCAECAKKIGNANVWSIAGAPERGAMRALIINACGHSPMATSMIKAARKTASNAELARAFEDIFRAPTHEHVEIFCAECAKKIGNANVWSIAGAPVARSNA